MTVPKFNRTGDWPRLVADAINRNTNGVRDAAARLTAAETDIGTLQTGLTAAEGAATALDGRVTALEAATAYTVDTVTYTPTTTPGSPVAGMTYFDSGTLKLRTWDGTIWNDHW